MKLTLQHHSLRSTDELDSLIEERILALEPRLRIDEASVSLECRRGASPPFSARIHLVTPGPDVVAESRDHTIHAAVLKAIAEIEFRLHHRESKRVQRAKNNLQAPAARARSGHAGR